MDRQREAATLRAELARLPRRGRGRPYPEALRQRATSYLHARRAEGITAIEVGRELGMSFRTLQAWSRAAPKEAQGFERINVVEASPKGGAIVVHGPGGLRVEGLDVIAIAELLRRLG